MVQVLFPASMLNERKVDEHFVDQYTLVRDCGMTASLYDGISFRGLNNYDPVLYRGWIMRPEEYGQMEVGLRLDARSLITDAACYNRGQFVKGWYESFVDLTPKTLFFAPDVSDDELLSIEEKGAFIIKDSSKSFKHYWEQACYAPSVADLPGVVQGFRELSEGDVLQYLVVREFEEWSPGETRLWWVDGRLAVATAHPDTPHVVKGFTPEEIEQVQFAVASLKCPFVTTDVVRAVNGSIRVVEVGDGQVSDIPSLDALVDVLSAFGNE